MSWFSFIIVFGVLQGIILLAAISRMKKGNKKANTILSGFILIIILTLLGRYFYNHQPFTIMYFKVLYIGDLIIFLFGPMLYFYLLALFEISPKLNIKMWVHFIPVAVFIILVIPFVIADRENLLILLDKYEYFFWFIEVSAIIQNFFYLILNGALLKKYINKSVNENSEIPKISFYKLLLILTGSGLFFWIISFILRFVSPSGSDEYIGYQMVWVSLSASIIALGYYAISNPDALQQSRLQKKYESKPTGIDNIEELSLKLEAVMKDSKPYLQPKLTLSELSRISGINIHLLSRIINEKYNRNFFEFINNYRIEDFKTEIRNSENSHLTFLAVAYQVGFNSKTTFNTAFKKIEKKTPREFLKSISLAE